MDGSDLGHHEDVQTDERASPDSSKDLLPGVTEIHPSTYPGIRYVAYQFSRARDGWYGALRHRIPDSQAGLKRRAQKRSKSGSALDQLLYMGADRRFEIQAVSALLNGQENNDTSWEPVFIETQREKRTPEDKRRIEVFDVIFRRQKKQGDDPENIVRNLSGSIAKSMPLFQDLTRANHRSQSSTDDPFGRTVNVFASSGIALRYEVACICPAGIELAAIIGMLDKIHPPSSTRLDENAYTLGRVGRHNVVVAAMPTIGNDSVTMILERLRKAVPSIQFALLVGIGGGVPGNADVRLGDVVVSRLESASTGILQFDLKDATAVPRLNKRVSTRPPGALLSSVRFLETQDRRIGHRLSQHICEMVAKYPEMETEYLFPMTEQDQLFIATYKHRSTSEGCDRCDGEQTIARSPRSSNKPEVHYGNIASATSEVKDAKLRDDLQKSYHILCIEREAAGLNTDLHCIAIRGICDYTDSHKNRKWLPYGAAVAAAYMKELLLNTTEQHKSSLWEPLKYDGDVLNVPVTNLGNFHTEEMMQTPEEQTWLRRSPRLNQESDKKAEQKGVNNKGNKIQFDNLISVPFDDESIEDGDDRLTTSSHRQERQISDAGLPPTDSGYASRKDVESFDEKQERHNDIASILSDNEVLDLEEELRSDLSVAFVNEIFHQMSSSSWNWSSAESVLHHIPDLLKEFSVHLKCSAKSKLEKNTAIFIRHHRRLITIKFQQYIQPYLRPNIDSDFESHSNQSDIPSAREKVENWAVLPLDPQQIDFEVPDDVSDMEEEVNQYPQYFAECRNFIVESLEFRRFLLKATSLSRLTSRSGTAVERIRHYTMEEMALHSPIHIVTAISIKCAMFEVDWALSDYFHDGSPAERLLYFHEFLTITGTPNENQLASVGDYMQQVWPNTGKLTLDALRIVMQRQISKMDKDSLPHNYKISEHTSVEISQAVPHIRLKVVGIDYDFAEMAEQLSWLGAACRLSPFENDGCLVFAEMRSKKTSRDIAFHLKFRTTKISPLKMAAGSYASSSCWHAMFKNPVIVPHFPIRSRTGGEKGMEMPFEIMAHLAVTDSATWFDGGMVLKGFSSMLVPVRHAENSIQWHFLCDFRGRRLSYWKADEVSPQRRALPEMNFRVLKLARHFVGWTSSAVMQTGAADIDYDSIRYTGSNFSKPGCALEKVSISGGHFLGGGMTFSRGDKDAPTYLNYSSCYARKIHFARSIYVVLYDSQDRRGWLVDGASALLHLVRAILSNKRASAGSQLQLADFEHPALTSGPDTAMNALLNETNRKLPIFEQWEDEIYRFNDDDREEIKKKKITWTFQHLVEETWGILEQIHEHQVKQLSTPGVGLRGTTRDKLEGFGFKDIVEGRNPLRPRVAMLRSSGRGWVDLTRKLLAITLMARGFGELIVSTDSETLCSAWKTVPKNQDYLATCTWLLQEICDLGGDEFSNPLELYDGIYWHKGAKLFEPCGKCGSGNSLLTKLRCDRVQVLLPPSLGHKTHPRPFSTATVAGGIIFGRSAKYKWRWPLTGEPSETVGVDDATVSSDEDEAVDSGLGTSISTS